MEKIDFIIGLDPGISGGISILRGKNIEAFKIPIKSIKVNRKNKNTYDIDRIVDIFKKYRDRKVLFIQEAVHSMVGEGSTSSFNFGKSSGLTLGIAAGLGFKIVEISPQKWKKYFSELSNSEINKIKEEIKKKRIEGKILKDKEEKKLNNKYINKLSRQMKSEAKQASIDLVKKKFPKLIPILKYKNTDGVAESVLIALYGQENKNELV